MVWSVTILVAALGCIGGRMEEPTAARDLAAQYAAYLCRKQEELPPNTRPGLAKALDKLRNRPCTACAATLRDGDFDAPYGDGSASSVATILCDGTAVLGLRISVRAGGAEVLGWSEQGL